ncbi:MAG: FliI/YscN family ATPase [Planctomycetes bacterium]|nr:FliI/YscN family ATPase [Planctomycetota bacterium]MBI3843025.1 FliI/YscN family ATPase [Planctomycetota bacterium]
MTSLDAYKSRLPGVPLHSACGRVTRFVKPVLECEGLVARIGELCRIDGTSATGSTIQAEVVGFRDGVAVLLPIGDASDVTAGATVRGTGKRLGIRAGEFLLGRVVDALGQPIDSGPPFPPAPEMPLERESPAPLDRQIVSRPIGTGVRAIDGLLTCGRGQRIGVFAGSGIGKSTLCAKIARETDADVSVIALVGERGVEVRAFLEETLGPEGLARSVVVVATSDSPTTLRLKAAFAAVTIAEHFRDRGKDVLFLMDSVTRFAAALREAGLAMGEPPTAKGYPPSMYATLPRLVERLGSTERGSITGFLSVLVEGDDMNDPVADTMRSLLDGHVVLSRGLANEGHFPSIDLLASVSRSMPRLVSDAHRRAAQRFRELYAAYVDHRDLIQVGAYRAGGDPLLDEAVTRYAELRDYLRQGSHEAAPFDASVKELLRLLGGSDAA